MNVDETRSWLEIFYGDTPGFINICSTLNWAGKTFSPGNIEEALAYICQLDAQGAEGIYARATTLRTMPESGRGGDDLSFYLPGLWADIDIAGPGHKTKQVLPPTVADAMKIISESGLPQPSHWVHSGGGLYPWWLLRTPVEIDDVETFRTLSAGWQKVIEASAVKLGFHYGSGIGDLSRVLRIPGTINRKEGLQRPCGGLEGHSWDGQVFELSELIDALAACTPEPPVAAPLSKVEQRLATSSRPGDDFNNRVSWHDLLLPLGWQWVYKRGDKWHLRRPGKTSGTSATLSNTTDRLFVFSEECHPLDSWKHYSKFELYAAIEHHGNYAAAAKELARLGYGTPVSSHDDARMVLDSVKATQAPVVLEQAGAVSDTAAHAEAVLPEKLLPEALGHWGESYPRPKLRHEDFLDESFTVRGAGNLYAKAYEDAFRYCGFQKAWHFWDGKVWRRDNADRFEDASKHLLDIGDVAVREAEASDAPYARKMRQYVEKLSNMPSPNIPRWARSDKRIAVDAEDFDAVDKLITLKNGIYDLESHTLMPHDPKMLLTKAMPVSFDKDAEAPKWLAFLEDVLPDVEVRNYLQRAVGHALLGRAEQRALFLLHGKSGCGKSQFIRVIEQLFGDFAETATPATFNGQSKTASITNDLNDLKGKRFVSVSELDEGEQLNESLVKRLTGGDTAKSRALWQENTKWRVKFSLFMATNNLPRLSSDDDAIWRRVKPVEFPTIVKEHREEILGLADKIFAAEAAGVLNWVLDGVREYQEKGLDDLPQIASAAENYRREVDVVEQFLAQSIDDDVIRLDEKQEIQSTQLHGMYVEWCRSNGIKGILAIRRFSQRVERAGYAKRRSNTARFFVGIGQGSRGMLGTIFPMRS